MPKGKITKEDIKSMAADTDKPAISYVNKMTLADFSTAPGETFGLANVVRLSEGQVAGPFIYERMLADQQLGEYDPVDVHEAKTETGETVRLPLQASFQRQVEDADLRTGDKFLLARLPDSKKQKGKGKGKMMAIYRVKVTERAPRAKRGPKPENKD